MKDRVIRCLLALNIYEYTAAQIYELREENKLNPSRFVTLLPEYCIGDDGKIKSTESYLQFVGRWKPDDNDKHKYILFTVAHADTLLEEEIANTGLDDVFHKIDLRPYFKTLNIRPFKEAWRRLENPSHLAVDLEYVFSYDYEYGYELDEVIPTIFGYFDKNLNLIPYAENKEANGETVPRAVPNDQEKNPSTDDGGN